MASVRMTNELRHKICREAERTFKKANPPADLYTDDFHQILRSELQNNPIQKYLNKITALPEYAAIDNLILNRTEQNALAEERPLPYRAYTFRQTQAYPKERAVTKVIMISPTDPYQPSRGSKKTVDDLWTEYEMGGYRFRETSGHRYTAQGIDLKTPLTLMFPAEETASDEIYVSYNEISTEHREEIFRAVVQGGIDKVEKDEERKKYVRSIKDLIEECNTVKQLLDAWPAAENLLPDGILTRLHEKSDKRARTTRIREKVSFDATAANQVVLTAKLAS